MYQKGTTDNAFQRQNQLEDALLMLMQTHPYEKITIQDICGQLGVSRKSFYHYFESKDDALFALIDKTIMSCEVDSALYATSNSSVCIYEQFVQYWKEQKPFLDALEKNDLEDKLLLRALKHAKEEDDQFRYWLHVNDSQCGDEILQFATGGVFSMILGWHQSGYQKSITQMAQAMNRLLEEPLVYPPAD